jgi:hypothetical protein
MLNKSRFAIAAALILGAVSAAQAANENMERELGSACGPLHQRMGGRAVNPVYRAGPGNLHRTISGVSA